MGQKPRQYDDDDGRVICSMEPIGLHWYERRLPRPGQLQPPVPQSSAPAGDPLTASEARQYTWYAVLAGLSVVGVFAVTWVLFILFCIHVWFK